MKIYVRKNDIELSVEETGTTDLANIKFPTHLDKILELIDKLCASVNAMEHNTPDKEK